MCSLDNLSHRGNALIRFLIGKNEGNYNVSNQFEFLLSISCSEMSLAAFISCSLISNIYCTSDN